MKIVRVAHGNEARFGILEGERVFALKGNVFGSFGKGEELGLLSAQKLLAPMLPSKVVALGLNYADHAREMKQPIPSQPILFLKPSTSVIGPGEKIVYPEMSKRVDYEAELAVVIKMPARNVAVGRALEYVLGYTCLNDVTARDLQAKDGQWTRAKSFDTFCPIGPWIETELDPAKLRVRALLNYQTVQDSDTGQLIFKVPEIVSFVSRVMTLLPGDLIATGTPPGVGPMQKGDKITIEVEGIGRLENSVA
jgi:2-keto-4-pentenoate hydratase/2-oxohepta-3-ene-1,7-dioic acid hydratase in catechol pathway